MDGADEADIPGRTTGTYNLPNAQVGKTIRVRASFTDDAGNAESRTSAPTATVEYRAPSIFSVTVGVGQAVLVWGPPVTGGLLYTHYEYRYSAGGMIAPTAMWQQVQTGTGGPQAYYQVVKGLTSGTTHTFQVRTATDVIKGASATMTATPVSQPSCTIDELGDRRLLWQGQLTAGVLEVSDDGDIETGYGTGGTETGTLTPDAVTFRSTTYSVTTSTSDDHLNVLLRESDSTWYPGDEVVDALRWHVCNTPYDFSSAAVPGVFDEFAGYQWNVGFNWPAGIERTLRLSLPANNAATGEPAITGTAQAGQDLTADASLIMDTDGLTDVDFTYQWLRVDADGTSNEAEISGEIAETYTLTNDDVGKKVKVKVSFTDQLSGEEERTSAAYPSSGTVTASANTTAPMLTSVTVTSTPRKTTDTYGAREHIEFTMTFDAPVTVTGDPTFAFDLGGATTASYYAGSGTTTLRFSHAVTGGSSGDRDTNGISWAETAIALNGGTIAGTDNAVAAVLTHVAQSNLAAHKVDGRTTPVTPATVTDVVVTSTPTSLADTYGFGETIVITVTVSEAVEVEGDPVFRFSLTNPGSAANNPQATYDRTRSIATTIVFTYTVQAGDRDTNGIWIGTHSQTFSLDANDRTRTASQQIDIDRNHLEKGTQGGHKVDGSLGAPTVPPDPTAPTLVSATATTLTIEWTHPGDGGSPLTRNFIEYRVEGTTDWTNWYRGETPTPVTRTVITNLQAATAYDVRVHSTNAIGNSQWVQSATAFSTLGGTASCPVPTFTGRRKIWTGVLTMGDFTDLFPANSFRGYDSIPDSGDGGGLDPATFTLGSRDYEIRRIALHTSGADDLNFVAGQGDGVWWDSTVDALRLHVCNTNFDFSDSSYLYTDDDNIVIQSNHLWTTDLDWSGVTTRTVHMSLPMNRPATGAPVITGPATVGQVLAVDVTGIEDEDGLHDVEYTYQWVRVDADGTSNEEDITDATADTYTLTDDDLGKKVKIEVSFPDDFGSDEQRTSAPTDTVTAVAMTTPGVTVSTTALTVTEEDTTGATYTVVLDSQPTANVTVTVAGHAGTDVTLTPSSATLTFTTTTWGTAQTVTVTAGDDADTANDAVSLTHSAASTDTGYEGITIAGVAVRVTDNDAAKGVTVSKTALTVTEEDTTGATYTVVLDSQPTATVTVTVAGHAGTDVTPSPTSLTFTPTTWGTAQTVTVTAGDDADTANDAVTLTHSAASTDTGYEGISIDGVAVTVTDNDNDTPPGVTVSTTALTVTEEDTTGATYTVVLDSQPTATVTVTVTGHAGTDVTPSPTSLTFTTTTWGTAQTVTVTAGPDADTANESVSLTHSAASLDSDYDGISIDGVAVTVNDNDTAPPPPPPPPVTDLGQVMGLGVAPGNAHLVVTWTAVSTATGYTVQWMSGGQGYTTGERQATITSGSTTRYTIPSLTNGTAYTVRVIATRTGATDGPPSEVTGTPLTTPGAPQRLRSEPGDAQVTLTWAAPASNGGSAILRYEYAVDDSGTWIDAGDDLEETVPGLTNGQRYTVAVRAVNAAGAGPAAEVTGTPVTTPDAPQDLRSEPGDAQVTLRWDAPASDGGSPILRYEYAVDDSGTWIDAGGDLEATVRDLTSGQSYAVAVRAVNAAGAGPAAEVTGTPVTTPGAPQRLRSEPGDAQVTLRWDAPASDGGSPILRYEYALDDSGTWIDAGGDLEATVRDLTNGQSYAVAVRAVNAAGAGPAATVTSVPADPLPQAWLARFGRTATDHVVEAVSSRWHGGPQASHLTLGGPQAEALFGWTGLGGRAARNTAADRGDSVRTELASPRLVAPSGGAGQGVAGTGPGMTVAVTDRTTAPVGLGGVDRDAGAPLRGRAAQRALLDAWGLPDPKALTDLRAALMGSSFVYAGAQDDDGQARTPGWLGEWSAWGRGAASWFSGAEGVGALEGEVATAMLGFDSRWGRWRAGVVASHSRGQGTYTPPTAPGGAVASTLTALHPYAGYDVNARTSVWGVVGYGVGEVSLTPARATTARETDLTNTMAAVGGRAALSVRSGRAGRFELALRSDARLTNTGRRRRGGAARGDGTNPPGADAARRRGRGAVRPGRRADADGGGGAALRHRRRGDRRGA